MMKHDGISIVTAADGIGFTVQGKQLLVATEPALGIRCPSDVGTVGSMVAAVDKRERSALFHEKHLAIVALYMKVAVNKQGTPSKSTPERLLSIKVDSAMAVDCIAIKGIVGTFKVAILVCGVPCTVKRIEV